MKKYTKPTVTPLGSVTRLTASMLRGSFMDMFGMHPTANTGARMMA